MVDSGGFAAEVKALNEIFDANDTNPDKNTNSVLFWLNVFVNVIEPAANDDVDNNPELFWLLELIFDVIILLLTVIFDDTVTKLLTLRLFKEFTLEPIATSPLIIAPDKGRYVFNDDLKTLLYTRPIKLPVVVGVIIVCVELSTLKFI